MSYKPNDSYFKVFTTASPTTGAATNADSLPVATANKNGTDDGTFTLTVANLDTGRYKITGTVPGGYASGDCVNVTIAATVGGIAGKAVVDTFGLDSKRVGDLNDIPASAVASQLTAQGYTSSRATKLDNLDAAVSSRSNFTSGGNVNVATIGGMTLTVPGSGTISIPNVLGTSTYAGGAVASVTAPVTVGTNNDKSGYGISGNVTVGGYSAGQDPATLVLEVPASSHNTANSVGAKINGAVAAGDPWATALPGSYSAGSAGAILGGRLDAAVSTRSTFAGGAVASVTAPVTIGTNNDKTGYSLAGNVTVGGYANGQDPAFFLTSQGYTTGRAAKIDNLDSAVSTRSTFTGGAVASVTAPVTVGTNNDKTGYSISGTITVGGYASGQDPATLVLDVVASGHNTPNTIGGLINAPGGVGADPWNAALPGNYASGTAGAIVGGYANPSAKVLFSLFPPNFAALSIDPYTGGVKVAMNMDKSDYLLASSGLDAIPVETGVNVRQALSPILAATAGVVSGAGTGTIVIKGGNVPDTRIKATTDKAGNRTAVTLTLPPASFVAPGSSTSYYFPSAYFPKVYFPIGKTITLSATS